MNQQTNQTTAEVERLATAWIDAERRADTKFLERTLSDDFVGVGPLGFLLTKPEWLQRITSGALVYDVLDWSEATARVYGDAAVVIGRQTSRARYQGQEIRGDFRTTLIAVKQDGTWRLAGVHFSPIGAPPIPSR